MTTTPNTDKAAATTGSTRSTSRGRKAPAAPEAPATDVTAEQLQSDSYTTGQLRTMLRTSKNTATKKLAQAELDRRAKLAQDAARSANRVSVAPEVAAAAQAAVQAKSEADKAAEKVVMDYLKANPAASAPATFKATGVSYSRVRKIAEANGHRFNAQDRTVARVLTPAEAKALQAIEQKMGASLTVLARALKAYTAA